MKVFGSATFIWVAVALGLVGLCVTFFVPRRQLWAKVTPERTFLAGVAARSVIFDEELADMATSLNMAGRENR